MGRSRIRSALAVVALAAVALATGGCANCRLPRIDPSGEHFFLPPAPPQPPVPQSPTYHADPGPQIGHHQKTGIQVHPAKVIAPVGSEVVLTAGVCGQHGYLEANQSVEWMVAPGGVGQIVSVGDRGYFDFLLGAVKPHKLTNTYAIGPTSSRYLCLTRGTPACGDNVPVLKGQAWVTVSSPIEGTSMVTAYAPNIYGWDARQRTATVYWIDAQWTLPPPAINPAGTRHVFTTTVLRHTNCAPLVGYRVRYEVASGPAAGFSPNGAQAIEVTTDAGGQARAEIFQTRQASGTNKINIQIIRPAEKSADGAALVLGSGSTLKTWSTPDISLRKTGPSQGTVGATLTYRIDVRNPGDQKAMGVVVTDQLTEGLSYLNSTPAATVAGQTLTWALGDLKPGESRSIDVNFRADKTGTLNNCATAKTAEGLTAQDCAATTIVVPTVDVQVTGPPEVPVGQQATFDITVTNRGTVPTTGLKLRDSFDPGLQHAVASGAIDRALDDLRPGESRKISVTFTVRSPGQQCQTVEVLGAEGVKASARVCVNGVAGPATAPPVTAPPITAPPATAPSADKPVLSVKKTGPTRVNQTDTFNFAIEVTNTGRVPATNVQVADSYDLALKPVQATPGVLISGYDLIWKVPSLAPGETKKYTVQCQCLSAAAKACNRAVVTCQEGVRGDAEACLEIVAAGAPAAAAPPPASPPPAAAPPPAAPPPPVPGAPLSVTVTDNRDPTMVGADNTFEIRVQNNTAASDRNVQVTVLVPPELTPSPVGTSGPAQYAVEGQTVRFGPVQELRPGEPIVYRVLTRGARPSNGPVQVQAQVTSANSPQPITATQGATVVP
jgi:uncharacterized repeat protein (TIGR01451 family)